MATGANTILLHKTFHDNSVVWFQSAPVEHINNVSRYNRQGRG
jgi:hypothetical protein